MKNTIIFLLISLLQCLVYGQDKNKDLFGTWQTDDKMHEIKIDKLLNGTYENKLNNRTLKFIANGLSNFENEIYLDIPDAIAVSISLMNDHEGDKVNSTMTGQMYIDTHDNYTKILQLFHVLKTDNNDLNSGETLFFKKTDNISPLVTHNEIANSDSSLEGLIGPWKNSDASNGLNIIHIIGNNISATYNYFDPNMKQNFLIKLKGYVQSTTNGNYYFSLSGISLPFPPTVRVEDSNDYIQLNSYSMSLVGEIIDNGDNNYSIKSSLNLAHAYGIKATYSAVRSQGAYFTKSKTSSFDYEVIQNGMERLKFTNNGATNWVSNMKIGSNQTLKMALDTGGNYDWVNSTQCKDDACKNYDHTQFNHLNSKSFTWIDEGSKLKNWGPWGDSEANLGFDLVKIDPNNVVPREISLIEKFIPPTKGNIDQFKELLWDGALAIPSYSSGGKYKDENSRISNVIIDLVTSGTIDPDKLKVSFYYDKGTGKGTYVIGSGVIDESKVDIESKITLAQKNYVYPNSSKDPYIVSYLWSTALNSVKVGGETIKIDASNTVFAFDTGSSALKGDPKRMDKVKTILKDLSNSPTIEYSMGMNKEGETGRFVITPEQYNQEIEEGDKIGTKQIQVKDLPKVTNLWCQGTTLLEDLYSVFTYDISFNTRGELVLKARNVELYNKVGGPQIIQPQFTCEEEYTDSGGVSGNYEDNASETIVYRPGTKGERVALQLFEIDIELNYDFLSIYDGPNDSEVNLLKTYTGYHVGEKIISSHPSGALTVKFTSDGSVTKPGWTANVIKCSTEKTPDNCEKEEFTDLGGALGNYKNHENYATVYSAEAGKKVEVLFDYIDLSPWGDLLIVFDGPTINWSNYKKYFTGYHANKKITSTHPSGALTFLFWSNFWWTDRGWKASVNKCKIKTGYSKSNNEKEQKVNLAKGIDIFPNPVASRLHIMIPSSEKTLGDSVIIITNLLGKVVGNYIYKDATSHLEIDLSQLSAGTYFVKISNLKGETIKKIIKL